MKNLTKMSGDMLSKLGKFGIGKSLMFGAYDIEIPAQMKSSANNVAEVEEKRNQDENCN